METVNNQSNQRVTLIDATTLDDDQFNQLISSIDARNPVVLYLLCLLMVVAGFFTLT